MREVTIKDGEDIIAIRPFDIAWENSHIGEPTKVHITGMVLGVNTDQLKGKEKCGPEVKRVIYNGPATVVLWADGTKTVVKCQPGDVFDRRIGFLTALAKKVYGGRGKFNDIIRKATEEGY